MGCIMSKYKAVSSLNIRDIKSGTAIRADKVARSGDYVVVSVDGDIVICKTIRWDKWAVMPNMTCIPIVKAAVKLGLVPKTVMKMFEAGIVERDAARNKKYDSDELIRISKKYDLKVPVSWSKKLAQE